MLGWNAFVSCNSISIGEKLWKLSYSKSMRILGHATYGNGASFGLLADFLNHIWGSPKENRFALETQIQMAVFGFLLHQRPGKGVCEEPSAKVCMEKPL